MWHFTGITMFSVNSLPPARPMPQLRNGASSSLVEGVAYLEGMPPTPAGAFATVVAAKQDICAFTKSFTEAVAQALVTVNIRFHLFSIASQSCIQHLVLLHSSCAQPAACP